jgi:hypothetical protein
MKRIFFISLISILLNGCKTFQEYHAPETPDYPSYNNRYTGRFLLDLNSEPKALMNKYCANYGGVYEGSISSWLSHENLTKKMWVYTCTFGTWQYQKEQDKKAIDDLKAKEAKAKEDKINKAKKDCAELGRKPGTDKYMDCILELTK